MTNCSGLGSVTKTASFVVPAPSLSSPSLTACQYFDGTFKASLRASNYDYRAVLKVYRFIRPGVIANEYIGNMIDGQFTTFIYGEDDYYFVTQELCSYVSNYSNIVKVSLDMRIC
jgi:hypothetical protein